jgi:ribonuclease P protein component
MEDLLENNNKKRSFTFSKEERLCSKKIIDELFAEGRSFVIFPLKIVFIISPVPGKFPAQAAFSASKRIFKRAVHRNLIKRKIREAYRLNKHLLYEQLNNVYVAVFVIFIGKSIPDFKQVEDAMKKGIERLIKEVDKKYME